MTRLAVGDEIAPLVVAPITRTTLALFAGASGDHNPIHIDIDAAREAGLDDVFAHGMLVMAHVGRLVAGIAGPDRVRRFEARFTAVTPVHARPTCHAVVLAVEDRPDGRLLSLAVRVVLDDGTETVRGSAEVLVPSSSAPAGMAPMKRTGR